MKGINKDYLAELEPKHARKKPKRLAWKPFWKTFRDIREQHWWEQANRTKRSLREYKLEFFLQQKKIPSPLLNKNLIACAAKRYRRLHNATRSRPLETKMIGGPEFIQDWVVPQRYDVAAHVLQWIKDERLLNEREATVEESQRFHGRVVRQLYPAFSRSPPKEMLLHQMGRAEQHTNWGYYTYNCRVLLDPASFVNRQQFSHKKWGYIEDAKEGTVLAIQLFDPNPKALLAFTKAMAHKRPNDPIPILDMYGDLFYPPRTKDRR
ncbi:MAG: hypothetical protein HY393_04145 [Candidatus Diapherotrites archaeon]|nr:hypothetical protein [Candidatus Diapherotrites archaeon]